MVPKACLRQLTLQMLITPATQALQDCFKHKNVHVLTTLVDASWPYDKPPKHGLHYIKTASKEFAPHDTMMVALKGRSTERLQTAEAVGF